MGRSWQAKRFEWGVWRDKELVDHDLHLGNLGASFVTLKLVRTSFADASSALPMCHRPCIQTT